LVFHSDEPRHALVTGMHGFTGSYLRQTLEGAGYRVTGTHVDSADATARVLDITSLDQCRRAMEDIRPTHIVHLAAISFVGHDDALEMYRVNVLGTLNLLQACADVGHIPDKILIASSANVYGNTEGVLDESLPLAPVNHYGASKVAMEHMARTWFDRLPIVITRPFNYTGVGQSERFLVPKIVSHFVQKRPFIELGNLDVERDFSDVRSVVDIYRALLECKDAGEVVNVCSEHPYTLKEVVQMAQDASGHELEIRVNPAFVRQNEVIKLVGSAVKLKSLVPKVQAIDFKTTIQWMVGA